MNYQKLKVGDIRQLGDEHRCNTTPPTTSGGFHVMNCKAIHKTKAGTGFSPNPTTSHGTPNPTTWSGWTAVILVGHAILASDLCNSEFRRPV